jgi:hypothetical protein
MCMCKCMRMRMHEYAPCSLRVSCRDAP